MPDHKAIRDEHFRQLNAYRDDPANEVLRTYEDRAAFFARRVGTRWEIDRALFEEFLDLLPRLGWCGDSFYPSEFLFDDITARPEELPAPKPSKPAWPK